MRSPSRCSCRRPARRRRRPAGRRREVPTASVPANPPRPADCGPAPAASPTSPDGWLGLLATTPDDVATVRGRRARLGRLACRRAADAAGVGGEDRAHRGLRPGRRRGPAEPRRADPAGRLGGLVPARPTAGPTCRRSTPSGSRATLPPASRPTRSARCRCRPWSRRWCSSATTPPPTTCATASATTPSSRPPPRAGGRTSTCPRSSARQLALVRPQEAPPVDRAARRAARRWRSPWPAATRPTRRSVRTRSAVWSPRPRTSRRTCSRASGGRSRRRSGPPRSSRGSGVR